MKKIGMASLFVKTPKNKGDNSNLLRVREVRKFGTVNISHEGLIVEIRLVVFMTSSCLYITGMGSAVNGGPARGMQVKAKRGGHSYSQARW